jgi:hypothetical protein
MNINGAAARVSHPITRKQSIKEITSTAFEFECDGEIADVEVWEGSGPQMYVKHYYGVARYNKRVYVAAWESPAFVPDQPLTVMIYSNAPVKLIAVHKIRYRWPF